MLYVRLLPKTDYYKIIPAYAPWSNLLDSNYVLVQKHALLT